MQNKKLLILILVVLNVLNFGLRRGIARAMIYRLYRKHGILLSLKKIRIGRRLNIKSIYFKKASQLHICVKSFGLGFKSIHCLSVNIVFGTNNKPAAKRAPQVKNYSAIIQRLFRRLLNNRLGKLANLFHSIDATGITIIHQAAELSISNFTKEGEIVGTERVYVKRKNLIIAQLSEALFSMKKNNLNQFTVTSKAVGIGIDISLLSTEPLKIRQIDVNAEVIVRDKKIEIGRSSKFFLNNIPFLFEFNYDISKNDRIKFSFILILKGNSFFKNYPFFYTKELNNIEASGELVLQVIYVHDLNNVAAGYFRTKIIKDDLKIENFNTAAFSNLAGDFSYTATKNGKPLREIKLCACNPGFIKIEQVPKLFSNLVLTSEDPSFYEHKGIDVYNLQQAILQNFELGKFSRGASTITMQLARNVYLGHHKNIFRKLEELVIAWLLERHAGITKERILEIYLNIIEFGNNVYGISEASNYYFGKPVQELCLIEQLVLCYIIPRPDFFLDALLSQSKQLKENLKVHIHTRTKMLVEQHGIDGGLLDEIPRTIFFKPEFGSLSID